MLEKAIKRFSERAFNYLHSILENPILTSFLVLIVLTNLVLFLSFPYYSNSFSSYYGQVLIEAHGMLFDILIIGILIFWLNKSGEKRQRIKTYKEEIDDFRLWKSEEAAFRIVGNLKRLNRHKIFSINLVECYLPKTNLNYTCLSGSNLNSANLIGSYMIECNLNSSRLNQTDFENANLNQASLRGAYASGANFVDSVLIKADFQNAFLIKTNFRNAKLMEANPNGSFLMGAEFEDANLYKADFRNCTGLTIEQLSKARTLYLAKFDSELQEKVQGLIPELVVK